MADNSLDKRKIKFLLLEGVHPSAIEVLEQAGYSNIESISSALPPNELSTKIADAHFLGIRSRTQLTDDVFTHAKKLCAVGCFCIGTNQVDLEAATRRGIAVFNAPYSNTRSVAELVLAQLIFLWRGVAEKNALAHQGRWLKSATHSYEARGKKLGIIGYGNIGSQLGVLAESLGMDVYFYDIASKLPLGNAKPVMELETLLNSCDAISLHVPETPQTQWMIGSKQFAKMKPQSIFVNASRGTVVIIEALQAALESGHLLGAAIDVFPSEPESNDDPFVSPLTNFNNVILTPHIGGSTQEAQQNIGREVAEQFVSYSDVGSTLASVNFPQVALPSHPGKHRLLHIHHNVAGILGKINQILSDNAINISGQFLQTNETIGYVVIDVDRAHSATALEAIRNIEGTIRCRVLY